jgi:hypothetical protein
MSFAFTIQTEPLLDKLQHVRQPYEETPLDLLQWKLEKTREAKFAEWNSDAARNARVRTHEEAEDKKYWDAVNKATLHAETARVLCVAYCQPESTLLPAVEVEWGPEKLLLARLWVRCVGPQRHGGRIYVASGSHHDIRFAWRRSLLLGVQFPGFLRTICYAGPRAFVHESFVDVVDLWAAGEYGRVRVSELAAAFGVAYDDSVWHSTFWKLAREDRAAAEAWAKQAAECAWKLGEKFAGVLPYRTKGRLDC